MALTLRQALQVTASLQRVKVVAGSMSLDNEVTFVGIMEGPEVARWVNGGEMLLTTGFPLKDNPKLRQQIIFDLAEKKVAALGIKPGQYLNQIPMDMIEYANQVGLPLLEIPPDTPYFDIMMPIFELLINEHKQLQQRDQEIHELIINLMLCGKGFQEICQGLAQVMENPIFIFSHGVCLGTGYVPSIDSEYINILRASLEDFFRRKSGELMDFNPHRAVRLKLKPDLCDSIIVPVACQKNVDGYLIIMEINNLLTDIEIKGIETGATIVALEFAKEKAVVETEIRIHSEFFDELFHRYEGNEVVMMRRAAHMGINPAGRLAVFIVGSNSENNVAIDMSDDYSTIVYLLRKCFWDYPEGIFLIRKGNRIIGLVSDFPQKENKLANCLQEFLSLLEIRIPNKKFQIGVGGTYEGLEKIKISYEEAELAFQVAWQYPRLYKPIFFRNLGTLPIMYNIKELPLAGNLCHEYMDKLKMYDHENGTDLVNTLKCFLKNDCKVLTTSQKLYVHKNSVVYRLQKIMEITGLDIKKSDDLFLLMMVVKLDQILSH
ncbi:MAG: PucR family transcriptional regulator ligand-binding domain-containing protein [Dehalobacterium sp.]